MKTAAVLALLATPALIIAACSQGDVTGTGGSSSGGASSGGSGPSASGSMNMPSGGSGVSGSSTAGGTPTTMGGSASGSGPVTAGSAGVATGGGGSGNGGSGMGGSAGSAMAGMGGGGGQAGGGGDIIKMVTGVPNDAGDSFMSSFFIVPCYGQMAQDCLTTVGGVCPSTNGVPFEQQGFTQTQVFKLGGTSGTMYNMTFTVNGVTEGKYYEKGMRDAGDGAVANAESDAGTDTFYRGGNPVAQEHYNIYKMTVKKPDGTELQHYYLNSFPPNVGRYENHNTFALHYQKMIPIVGGGSIELFIGDSNCHAVDNCGPGEYNGTCTKSRNIPSEPNLVIPTKYQGKDVASLNTVSGAKQPFHAQLVHITVNNVVAM